MSDYVFPFANVNILNDIFSDEILPYDHFNSLISLQNEYVSEVNINPWDDIDSEILEINTLNPCSYHDINSFGNLTGSDKFLFIEDQGLILINLWLNIKKFFATLAIRNV